MLPVTRSAFFIVPGWFFPGSYFLTGKMLKKNDWVRFRRNTPSIMSAILNGILSAIYDPSGFTGVTKHRTGRTGLKYRSLLCKKERNQRVAI